ncbi:14876_t:CDS:2 [Funneliformis mosseae]|uniref:14876_t:CDS:1 n=1 Tax=Funneliformis mosseae TaxID=27381 RepID=A0A9N8W0K6_FUNMO|nr:14876_t:CDS:2 [Funneliformis mosseae]
MNLYISSIGGCKSYTWYGYNMARDEQCHGIADMLGRPGNCENCMSCSRKMNNDMKGMEKFVKKSDGRVYIVACDNYEYAKTITQIFRPYKGEPTTTVIFHRSPTNYHDEM